MCRREDVLKLTDELTAWADSKDKTELDTTALAAKREGLVAQLSAERQQLLSLRSLAAAALVKQLPKLLSWRSAQQ